MSNSAGERLPGSPEPMQRWTGSGGISIAGDYWGDPHGPLVVLQHGGGQTRHPWKNAGETLGRAGNHAVAIDARGHGEPAPAQQGFAPGKSFELPSTSHFSIIDNKGNVVAMTTSIENVFGSRVMVRGFLLNNQLTDFSFRPQRDGKPVANAVAAGKRPRSSMAPIIAFDPTGELMLTIDSPGGSRIIGYVVQSIFAMIYWGLTPQEAIVLPRVLSRNGATEIESDGWAPDDLEALTSGLEALGHDVRVGELTSGLHAIAKTADGLLSGVDPRRAGAAAGY